MFFKHNSDLKIGKHLLDLYVSNAIHISAEIQPCVFCIRVMPPFTAPNSLLLQSAVQFGL